MAQFESLPLFEQEGHRFIMLGWEEKEEDIAVQTNQYIIFSGDEAILLDPGGAHAFPRVLANVAEIADLKKVSRIFYSHQDPDVCSGITMWLSMAERAIVHISELWVRFLPHFGVYDTKRILPIPDRGETLKLTSSKTLIAVPSHFLHSTGCFSLYDASAKILFSGDIGAAIFPKGVRYTTVKNFDEHVKYMQAFHRRYMACNAACRRWAQQVASMEVECIAPQHGALIQGKENVRKFLAWFEELRCGTDILEEFYLR